MMFLSSVVFLSAILVTQAEDISDDLKQEPLSEVLYLFDVCSEAPLSDVKGALKNFTIRHSFKVFGEKRYCFVILGGSVEHQHNLNFPPGSEVTQYPVEHAVDFFKMFGVTHGWEQDDEEEMFEDTEINMNTYDFLVPENTPTAVYKEKIAGFAKQYVQTQQKAKPVGYSVIAAYPAKMIFFDNIELNALQNIIEKGLNVVGGPGNMEIHSKAVLKI